MPGFDGTEPRGLGPMTGGGRGFCVVPAWRRNAGLGGGTGFYRAGYGAPYWTSTPTEVTPDQELTTLRNEADILRRELESIEPQIQELEQKE